MASVTLCLCVCLHFIKENGLSYQQIYSMTVARGVKRSKSCMITKTVMVAWLLVAVVLLLLMWDCTSYDCLVTDYSSGQWQQLVWYMSLCPDAHTQPFYDPLGFCPGLHGWAGTRKVKPIWICWSTGARDSEWQWHQLGHMQNLHLNPNT